MILVQLGICRLILEITLCHINPHPLHITWYLIRIEWKRTQKSQRALKDHDENHNCTISRSTKTYLRSNSIHSHRIKLFTKTFIPHSPTHMQHLRNSNRRAHRNCIPSSLSFNYNRRTSRRPRYKIRTKKKRKKIEVLFCRL